MPEKLERPENHQPKGYAGPAGAPKKQRSKASPARLAALDVVRAVRERDAFAQDVIGSRIDRSDLSSEDRAVERGFFGGFLGPA